MQHISTWLAEAAQLFEHKIRLNKFFVGFSHRKNRWAFARRNWELSTCSETWDNRYKDFGGLLIESRIPHPNKRSVCTERMYWALFFLIYRHHLWHHEQIHQSCLRQGMNILWKDYYQHWTPGTGSCHWLKDSPLLITKCIHDDRQAPCHQSALMWTVTIRHLKSNVGSLLKNKPYL